MSFLLAAAVSADVDADASNGSTLNSLSTETKDSTTCIDLNADCSTLMINYSGDSVEFALFRRESVDDDTYATRSADSDSTENQAAPTDALPGNEAIKSHNARQSLAMDFLQGFKDKSIDPAFKDELSAMESGAAGAGSMHGWAFAAATSLEHTSRQSNPDGIATPGHSGENSPTFWDFAHVYQWEVEENVLDSSRRDISQVALSDIYLSPKTNSTSDPKIVVCELNDQQNCRPLSD
jgi:hypothetical protein